MFYLWEYDTKNSDSKFFSCHIEDNNELIDIPWISGEKIDKPLNLIKYYADNMLPPEDFPFNGSIEILVSNKIVEILKKLKVTGIDYYESEIIQPNGNVCIFRSKLDSDSGGRWTLIPVETGHPFRR